MEYYYPKVFFNQDVFNEDSGLRNKEQPYSQNVEMKVFETLFRIHDQQEQVDEVIEDDGVDDQHGALEKVGMR